jgi:hypothetical protein
VALASGMSSPNKFTADGGESCLDTPVVFLVFNRPEFTRRVLEAIRVARPERLLVVADGPRPDRPGEPALCAEVRRVVDAGVDWPCKVERNYSEENLGCGRRVSSGLDWVFERVEEAIILEDDCLPDPTFFRFCGELLARYRDDERVAQISGCAYAGPRVRRDASYLFSRYGPIWGWATWRRAWRHYDFALSEWPRIRESEEWRRAMSWGPERVMRERAYDGIRSGRLDTWDYQWGLDKITHGMLSAISCVNLVENIGCGPEATHTTRVERGVRREAMTFPLNHPALIRDEAYDQAYSQHIAPGWLGGKIRRLRRLLRL